MVAGRFAFVGNSGLCISVVLVMFSWFILVSGRQHITYQEPCGGDDTCDKNKGLYCDVDKNVCLCSEAASWIRDFGADYHCRVMAGKKCGRGLTSPKCERGLHCDPIKEGDIAETICMCPEGQSCLEFRQSDNGDGNGAVFYYGTNSWTFLQLGLAFLIHLHL